MLAGTGTTRFLYSVLTSGANLNLNNSSAVLPYRLSLLFNNAVNNETIHSRLSFSFFVRYCHVLRVCVTNNNGFWIG
jgi:hypothetical protein